MHEKRRDSKGRLLKTRETQNVEGRYRYSYYEHGKHKCVYSWKLQSHDKIPPGKRDCLSLREKEAIILRNQMLYGSFDSHEFTVLDLVERYIAQKQGVRKTTMTGYSTVFNVLKKEEFGTKKIKDIRASDAKLWFVEMQKNGRGYSSIHNIRGVLRQAFQTAVDDDYLLKNPFDFELKNVVENTTQHKIPLTEKERDTFLEFIKNDKLYKKYYDAIFVLFHTGLRISEFCGLTLKDIDMENKTIHVNNQLQRHSDMSYEITPTKTTCGKRDLPMTPDVYASFQNIIKKRRAYRKEFKIDGHSGFLFIDKNNRPRVANHWSLTIREILQKYNRTHDKPLPKITPHICRHTYCTLMARAGINPKSLQYLMGHAEITTTLDVYTHFSFTDAQKEINKLFPHS